MRSLRFLILTQYFPPEVGAPQVRLGAFAKELVRLGHAVEVVTAMPNYPVGRIAPAYRRRMYVRETWNGATVHRVWMYACTGAGVKRLLSYLSFTTTALVGLARCRRPDFVFVESPPLFLGVSGYLGAKLWRAPMIFNVADLWPDSVVEMGLMKRGVMLRLAESLERWIYGKSAFVVAVTKGIADVLRKRKHLAYDRVLFLPNGADTKLFRPMDPDLELAAALGLDGRKLIVYAGTLGYAQGLDVALDAMRMIGERHPEVMMVFVGSGSDKSRLQAAVVANRIDNIRFFDPQPTEEIPALYSLATAGFASLRDLDLFQGALPSKLLPIMACGRPVLYSGRGEAARLVEAAKAGICVRPEDPQALADAIAAIVACPEHAAELGMNGRRYVEQHMNWRALVEVWLGELAQRTAVPARHARE